MQLDLCIQPRFLNIFKTNIPLEFLLAALQAEN